MKVYSVLTAILLLSGGCAHNKTGTTSSYHGTPKQYAAATSSRGSAGTTAQTSESASSSSSAAALAGASTNETTEIPLYREELRVSKRTVPAGGVLLRKVVETETTNMPVELRREDIVVERISPQDARTQFRDGATPFSDQQVVIALMREVPTTEKSVQVTEVVRANKSTETKNITLPETVRREEIGMDRSAPENVGAPPTTTAATASSAAPAERVQNDSAEIALHKEQLQVGKRQVSNGQITLRKSVVTENVSKPLELRSEKINIDRAAGGQAAAGAQPAFAQQEIYIPLTQEIPVIEKEVQLAQIVRARKNVETEQSTVSEQLRSERIEIVQNEKSGENTALGAPASAQSGAEQNNASASAAATAGERTFVGEITAADPANRMISVRNWKTGESRTFTFDENPKLTLKENRQPYLIDFKVGYPVRVGYTGADDNAIAHSMTRVDTPEVK